MINKYAGYFNYSSYIFLICTLLSFFSATSQIYKHDFGTASISSYPYTVAPTILNTNLSGSSWQNSVGSWASNTGATGQAIQLNTPSGTSTLTLTFNVATGYVASVTSFDFWSKRSNSGPQNWSMAINGISVGSGTVTTAGAALGTTTVNNTVTGLSGTVTVVLTVSNAGGGNIRLDDFTLNGTVLSNCNSAVVSSFAPASGPENTQVTITGTGFTGATAVKFDGISASYTVVSNTQIKAFVPAGASAGVVAVQAADGCLGTATTALTVLNSQCGSPDIYISELYDEYDNDPGAIELYNPTSATVTFNGDYTLERYGNFGDATPTYNITILGSVGPNQTYLIRSGGSPFVCTYAGTLSYGTSIGGINANDGFKLKKAGVLIDYVKVNLGTSDADRGYTMIRKPAAVAPSITFADSDWDSYANEFCSNLGMHTANPATGNVPAITPPQNQAVCQGGTATYATTVSGTESYTYQWKILSTGGGWNNVTNGATYSGATTASLTINNTPAAFDGNQYYCQITSATCTLYSDAALLTVGGVLTAPTVTAVQPTCTTAASITITAPTEAGMTYSIDSTNYQAGTTFSNLTPGTTYSVTAKNSAGCTSAITTQVINAVPNAPAAPTVTATQPTCATATASITITAPLGLTYSIDGTNYQSGTTFSNLTPGTTYSVTAKNSAGCTSAITTQVINAVPSAPAAPAVTATQPTCTSATASITVTAPLGLTYSIDGTNYQAGTTFSNLTPGTTYSVTAKNTDGCTSAITTQVINAVPSAPVAPAVTATQPTCTTATASITITAPLGLTYSIDGTNYQSGTTFSNLTPGTTYSVTTKNTDDCTSAITTQVINAVPSAPIAPTVTATQPTCTTAASITVTAPLGLTYSIDGTNYQAGTTFSNLTPDITYSITAKNSAGCISTVTTQVINAVPNAPAAPTVTAIQPTCITTASITVLSPLGMTYSIDGINYQAGTTFSNLIPGTTYSVTAKNSNGCVSAATSQVIDPSNAPAAPTVAITQPTCVTNTGSLTVTAPLGMTYSIDGTNYQAGTTFTGLTPGATYSITVKNAAGCVSAATVKLINNIPNAPVAPVLTSVQPGCTTATGSITVTAPLQAGMMYSINNGPYQTSATFANLAPGTYTVIAKSSAGCISPATSEVINRAPSAPAAPAVTAIQPTCATPTGTITITAVTGLTYSINNGPYQATTTFTGLLPGAYSIRTQNSTGCISAVTVQTINNAPALPATPALNITQPACAVPVGKITIISPIGATYSYSLDGITYQNSIVFDGLAGGTYTVTVKNSTGCTAVSQVVTINTPPAPAPSPGTITGDSSVCANDTVQLTASVSGGTWSVNNSTMATVDATGLVTPLRAGNVIVSYTVGTDCTASVQKTITINALPQPALRDMYLCIDTESGIAIPKVLKTNLSDTAYTFTWTKDGTALAATTSSILVLQPGNYTITATNIATGCSATSSAVVGTSSIALATAEATVDFSRNQVITIKVTGGSGDYEYSLDGGAYQDEPLFTGITDGEHTVVVNDINGCGTLELTVYSLTYPHFFSPNSDGKHDSWNIKGLAGQREAVIFIYDRYGKLLTSVLPSGYGWDGTFNGQLLPATDYWFSVFYESSTGIRKEFRAHFSLLR